MSNKWVLLVDNDADFLNSIAELLEREGYRVLKVGTFADAEQILHSEWVHLAILDVRLENDQDEKDISGIVLAKQQYHATIPKIILTQFPEHLEQLLQNLSPVFEFLGKSQGAQAIINAVVRAFDSRLKLNFDLTIDWNAVTPITLIPDFALDIDGDQLSKRGEELKDLFRRLFYEKQHLRIGRLLWRHAGCVALTTFAFKQGAAVEAFIVICGEKVCVAQEAQRFREFAPKEGNDTAPLPGLKAETIHFAANCYALTGADLEIVQSFDELYRRDQERLFPVAMQTLFERTLAPWQHREFASGQTKSLAQWYRERFRLDSPRISEETLIVRVDALIHQLAVLHQKANLSYSQDTLILDLNGKTLSYFNPARVLFQEMGSPLLGNVAHTPGLLSGQNILTDVKAEPAPATATELTAQNRARTQTKMVRTWLTDFIDAGQAPVLWNFVSIEAAIRFDWLEERDLWRLHELETSLTTSELGKPDTQNIEPIVRKPLNAIQIVQGLAVRAAGRDWLSYQIGMLFHATQRFFELDPTFPLTPNQVARFVHLLMALAMIGEQVAQRTQTHFNAKEQERGIRIEKANLAVYVNGKRVPLRGQSYNLLCYLYERAGQLCKREEIVQDVFKQEYSEDEENRLNTAIRRVRERIEDDPNAPTYLLTEPGGGYRLVIQP